MKLISIEINVPKHYLPDDETAPFTQEQNVTMQFGDYLPRLIEEKHDLLPLLNSYEINSGNVDISYEEEAYADNGYWLIIHVDLDEPRSLVVVQLTTLLRELILEWLDTKGLQRPLVQIEWSWRQRSGRLR